MMRDDETTLAGVEIASIVLRKADTLTQVTEKDHCVSPPHSGRGYFSHMRWRQKVAAVNISEPNSIIVSSSHFENQENI